MPKVKTNNKPSRSWAWTDWNVSDERKKFWLDLETIYVAFGEEVCPDSKRLHLQGFVTWKRGYRFTQMTKLLGPGVHCTKAAACDAMNYSMKDMKYTIQDRRKRGQRTDLEKAGAMIKDKKSLRELALEMPGMYIKFHRGFKALQEVLAEERTKPPTVVWRWGEAGTGKTRWAYDNYDDVWKSSGNPKWYDGFHGQKVAILDEVTSEFPFKYLLQLTDRYPMKVEVKGGHAEWNCEIIVITSSLHPVDEYRNEDGIEQLLRRCDYIINVGVDDDISKI